MRITFLKDITVDFVGPHEDNYGDHTFHRHDEITVKDVIPMSSHFYNIILNDGKTLLDVNVGNFKVLP
jgi:hypothetical protein